MGVVELADAPVHEFLLTRQELDSLPEPHWMTTADGHEYLLGRVGNPSPDSPLFILFYNIVGYRAVSIELLPAAFSAARVQKEDIHIRNTPGGTGSVEHMLHTVPVPDFTVEKG